MKNLSSEDKGKLHNEINQTLNHRFILATTGITVFGAFSAFLVPKGPLNPNGPEINLLYLGTAFIFVFLSLLVYWASTLQNSIRMISQYLIKCNASEWEKDVENLFTTPIPHGSSYVWRVFFILGIASFCWPLLIEAAASPLKIESIANRHIVLFVALVIYLVFWYWAAFVRTTKHKERMIKGWELVLGSQKESK